MNIAKIGNSKPKKFLVKVVIVPNPFYGCVFCSECMKPKKIFTLEGRGGVIKK